MGDEEEKNCICDSVRIIRVEPTWSGGGWTPGDRGAEGRSSILNTESTRRIPGNGTTCKFILNVQEVLFIMYTGSLYKSQQDFLGI